jgi:hypothetical protein
LTQEFNRKLGLLPGKKPFLEDFGVTKIINIFINQQVEIKRNGETVDKKIVGGSKNKERKKNQNNLEKIMVKNKVVMSVVTDFDESENRFEVATADSGAG